jgi:hypothetical protein
LTSEICVEGILDEVGNLQIGGRSFDVEFPENVVTMINDLLYSARTILKIIYIAIKLL